MKLRREQEMLSVPGQGWLVAVGRSCCWLPGKHFWGKEEVKTALAVPCLAGARLRHNSPPPLQLFPVWKEIPAGLAAPWPARAPLSPLRWPLPQGQLLERVQLRFPPAPAPCRLSQLLPPQLLVALLPLAQPGSWLQPRQTLLQSLFLLGRQWEAAWEHRGLLCCLS